MLPKILVMGCSPSAEKNFGQPSGEAFVVEVCGLHFVDRRRCHPRATPVTKCSHSPSFSIRLCSATHLIVPRSILTSPVQRDLVLVGRLTARKATPFAAFLAFDPATRHQGLFLAAGLLVMLPHLSLRFRQVRFGQSLQAAPTMADQ
jgi:hypothetical protein